MAKYQFLSDLEYYCINGERGFLKRKNELNFKQIMSELEQQKNNEDIKKRFDMNIEEIQNKVDSFTIVHNTRLESLLNIIDTGAIFPIKDMKKQHIGVNYRVRSKNILNEFIDNFVFGTVEKGDWIYGLYEIKFKKEIENHIDGAQFLPMSCLNYDTYKDLTNYLMSITYWRQYLGTYIAVTQAEPKKYLDNIPQNRRPEFLFPGPIPVSFIQEVICATRESFHELTKMINEEFKDKVEFNIKIEDQDDRGEIKIE